MENSSIKPFYQQYTGLLLSCVLVFAVALLTLAFLVVEGELKLEQFEQQQVPALQKQLSVYNNIADSQSLMTEILLAKDAGQYLQLHQRVFQQLKLLSQQIRLSGDDDHFPLLTRSPAQLEQSLTHLSQHSGRNQQLRQSVLIQVQLTQNNLSELMALKKQRQQELLRLINSDSRSDRVTVTRARAHVQLMNEFESFIELSGALAKLSDGLAVLSVQTTINEFEHYRRASELIQSTYQQLSERDRADKPLQSLTTQLDILLALLYEPQTMLAKWRSHLRLAEDYRSLISQQQQKLISFSQAYQMTETRYASTFPNYVIEAQQLLTQHFSKEQQRLGALALMLLSILVLILLLFKVRSRAKLFAEQSRALLAGIKYGAELTSLEPATSEQAEIIDLVTSIVQPKFSEQDYQQLLQDKQSLLDDLAQQQIYCWQLDSQGQLVAQKQLLSLLGLSPTASLIKILISALGKAQFKQIIACAKVVKNTNQATSVTIEVDQQYYRLTLDYRNGWRGVLVNQNDVNEQREMVAQLQQKVTEQLAQQRALDTIHQIDVVNQNSELIIATQQLPSLPVNDADLELLYRSTQLQNLRLLALNWQQKSLIRSDLELTDLLAELAINTRIRSTNKVLAATENPSNVSFSVNAEPQLNTKLNLHNETYQQCFQYLLAIVCDGLGQQHASIALSLSLADKNAGQHAVTYVLSVSVDQGTNENSVLAMPIVLSQLVNGVEVGADSVPEADNLSSALVLSQLLQHLYADNLQLATTASGYQLSFNLMHALAESAQSADLSDPIEFTDTDILTLPTPLAWLNLAFLTELPPLQVPLQVLVGHGDYQQVAPWLLLLNAIGCQLTFTHQSSDCLRYWQSGRYTVLLTNFTESPLVELSCGKTCSRAVISFQEQAWQLSDNELRALSNWQLETLSEQLNRDSAQQLLAVLAPWLQQQPEQQEYSEDSKHHALADQVRILEAKLALASNEYKDSYSQFDKLPAAFDLAEYASNQGSPELAVFMLEHHIASLEQLQASLASEIRHKNVAACQALVAKISTIARVMAASDLLAIAEQCQQSLEQQDFQRTAHLLSDLQQATIALSLYAEAI